MANHVINKDGIFGNIGDFDVILRANVNFTATYIGLNTDSVLDETNYIFSSDEAGDETELDVEIAAYADPTYYHDSDHHRLAEYADHCRFMQNEMTAHLGIIYKSIADDNFANTPASSPTKWEEFSSGDGGGSSSLIEYAHKWIGDAQIIGNKADFDGVGDHLDILFPLAIEDVFDGSGDYCLEVVVKSDANATQAIFSIGRGSAAWSGTDGHVVTLLQISGDLYWQWNTGGGNENLIATTDIQTSEVTIIVVRSGGRISVYNGVTRIATTETNVNIDNPSAGTLNAKLGDNDAGSDMDGQIDTIRISNVARYDPTEATITLESLVNDDDTVYFNNFTGVDGLTPPLNTE